MSEILPSPICEDREFLDFQTELFTENWSVINIEELNNSLDSAMESPKTFAVESPALDIDMNDIEFDIDGCNELLKVNNPTFNHLDSYERKGIDNPPEEIINLELPVIMSDSFEYNDIIQPMESKDEEYEESSSTNIPRRHPVEMHSYSILRMKETQITKSKNKSTLIKERSTNGRKYSISVNQKQKLYEKEPLRDPIAEKKRLNALNSKKNRETKKQQLQEAEQEIGQLRYKNENLKSEADQAKDELAAARRELETVKQALKLSAHEDSYFLDEREE
eukprot:GFUD01068237.1.p1 GENE.GFUD01068237.1~~GFUD01068237.1.p1  ORF type:complete len:278 (+),score=68.86 GFUD01068237.1:54-887(+)